MLKLIGKIDYIKSLNCSSNGNPRYNISINDLILTTKSDYQYCYDIENIFNEGATVEINYYETKTSFRIETIKRCKQ